MSIEKKELPKAGEVVNRKLYIHLNDSGEIAVMDYDASNFTYPFTLIGCVDIEFNMPDYADLIKKQIKTLLKKIESVDDKRLAEREKLEDKIQQLLAIGHDGGAI